MKKLTALFLVLALCLSLCTVTAFAANGTSSTILITNGLLPITENNEGAPTWSYIAPDNAWENENGAKAFIGHNDSKDMLVFRLGEEVYYTVQISDVKSLFPKEDGYHLLWTSDESSLGFNVIFAIKDNFTVLESIKVSGNSQEKLNGTYTAPKSSFDWSKLAKGVAIGAGITAATVGTIHTVKAIKNYKAEKAAAAEAAKLAEMPMVRMGDSCDAVMTLQTELNAQGYACGEVDGVFGQNTLNAVIAFQTANDLTADGIVGAQTWEALL